MKSIRVIAFLLFCLAIQVKAAGQTMLKTGIQNLPGALPVAAEKDSSIKMAFDLSKEKFYISVPKNYTGSQPFGILVYISPSDDSSALPPGWANVLQEKKLIFIAPQNVGNNQAVSRRAGLAVVAASKLPEIIKIDTNRVYVAGFSGGARMASYASFLRPDLFAGVLAVCGVDFPREVPRVQATKDDKYGFFSLDDKQADEAKAKVKFVLVTGSKDFRYGNILDIYKGGFQKDGYSVKLIDVPGMEHTLCSQKVLTEAFAFLDKKTAGTPGKK